MQFYRLASWLYVVVASLAIPLLVLDMCVDWSGITAAWTTMFAISVPLMVIQAFGLRRVLRDRAAPDQVSTLVTWYWLLHFFSILLVALAAAFYFADKLAWALWTLGLGALPMLGAGVAVGVVKLVLGSRLQRYPDELFGLRGALSVAFMAFGGLELANMVVMISLPFYVVAAMALVFLIAFIIEGHARPLAPRFGVRQVWVSYVLAALVTLGPPLAALPLLIDGFPEKLEQFGATDLDEADYDDQDEDEPTEEHAAPADEEGPAE